MSSIIYGIFGNEQARFTENTSILKEILSDNHEHGISEVNYANAVFGTIRSTKNKRTLLLSEDQIDVAVSGVVYPSEKGSGDSDAKRALNAYLSFGEDFAKSLRGYFVVIINDRKKNEIIISNDFLGLQPCYFVQGKDTLLISTEADALIECNLVEPKMDFDALAELFLIGTTIYQKTLLKDVKRLPPSSSIIINKDGGWKLIDRRNERFSPCIAGKANEDWIHDINILIDKSVKQKIDYTEADGEKMELSLSGGLDSRIILAFLLKYQYEFKAITCNDPNSTYKDDVIYSRKLSEAFKFDHEIYMAKHGNVTKFGTMLQHPSRNFSKDAEITGYAGEVLKGEYFKRVKIREIEESEYLLRHLFTKEFINKLNQNPNDTALNYIESINHPSPLKRKEIFFLDHLGSFFRRELPPQHRPKHLFLNSSHFPFLDRDLIEYIADIPMEFLKGKKLFMEYMEKMHPEQYSVPSTTKDRMNSAIKDEYDARITANEQQYMTYCEQFKSFSPLWQDGIFTGSFKHKYENIMACLFNVWHDYYFGLQESVKKMKECENNWIFKR